MKLKQAYQQACAAGTWQHDQEQQQAIDAIAPLIETWLPKRRIWHFSRPQANWLYLWGPSGTGKTKLMDLVCQVLPQSRVRRMHFAPFMAHIESLLAELGEHDSACAEALATIQKSGTDIICLDELYVDNITDAMVLGRLLEAALERGVVFFFTSNAAPTDLYPNGLQRDRFMRTIAQVTHTMLVQCLATHHDYRQSFMLDEQLANLRTLPSDRRDQLLTHYFTDRTELLLHSRHIPHSGSKDSAIWFRFAEICQTARHTSDYRALAVQYSLIVVSDVPILTEAQDDAAKRFILFIDSMYDTQTPCVIFTDTGLADWHGLYQHTRLKRIFMRTASRLQEMQSAEYLAAQSDTIGRIHDSH